MVFAILWDILDILLVDVVLIFGLASGLYTLIHARGGGYDGPADALYTTYKMLLLADFDDGEFAIGDSQILIKLLFVFSSLLGTIVILNLLIARMSDSYERIQEEAEMERLRLQARIIQKYEIFWGSAGNGKTFLHVVQGVGKNTAKVEKTEWAGVLNEVKTKMKKQNASVESEMKKIESEMDKIEKIEKIESEMKKQNASIES